MTVPIHRVNRIMFSPDGRSLWDLSTSRKCRIFARQTRAVNTVAFSPDGSLLATAANNGLVGLWTVATGQGRLSLDGQGTLLRTVAFSPGTRTLVLATGDDEDAS
jgi:WD40 repeat protein